MRKPTVPAVAARTAGMADKGLAVKDGLREVRFNVKHGARKLIDAVDAATQADDSLPGPLAPLGKPLNLAVRKAAHLLSNVDQAAVQLLAHDADYRSMDVPLRSSSAAFGTGAVTDLRDFTTDHHWRYRHWLEMRGRDDIFVHEQAIAVAGAEVSEAVLGRSSGPADDGMVAGGFERKTAAALVLALTRQQVLSKAALLPGESETDDELPDLQACGAVVIVLAGEIAGELAPGSGRDRYMRALRLADEIAMADLAGWQSAGGPDVKAAALGRWFAFVLRHV